MCVCVCVLIYNETYTEVPYHDLDKIYENEGPKD